MNVIYADEFRKQFHKIPREIQELFRKQEIIFRKDWRDPRLHVKKLKGHRFLFSFRITRSFRALFQFISKDTVLFATIGHRKDIYRKF